MSIFDALTGAAGHDAAANQRNLLTSLVPNLATTGQEGFQQAGRFLGGGFDTARNDLGTGYGTATGAINTGANNALGYLGQGTQDALGQLGQARSDLTANGGAYAPLSALASQYGQGAGLYADALGINGAQGNQNAVNAFQAGPGYQFALNQGVDAITRARNASGGLGGNSLKDTINYGQGLANQEYGNWLNRLSPYNNLQLSATQGAAAGNQANASTLANLGLAGANLYSGQSGRQASLAQGQGNSLSDLARQYYGQLGSNDITGGSALAGNAIGGAQNWQNVFGNAIPQFNDTFKQDAAASNAASANSLNLGMNLAKLAVGAATGMPMGGGGGISGGGGGGSFLPSSSFMNNQWGW